LSLIKNICFLPTPAFGKTEKRAEQWGYEFKKRIII